MPVAPDPDPDPDPDPNSPRTTLPTAPEADVTLRSTPPAAGPSAAPVMAFAYAVLRVVPLIERGECLNVGLVLFCRPRRFLGIRFGCDRSRLLAFAPNFDFDALGRHLASLERIAVGDATAGAIAHLPATERFGWLVAPSSTIVQPGPVHAGLTADPAATLDRLFARLVSPSASGAAPSG